MGYAGGTSQDPTYRNMGDHTETFQIDFNPEEISYEEILQIFWDNHNPFGRTWSRQYMSILFYHNEDQRLSVLKSKEALESKMETEVVTEIVPFSDFYLAEDYHQKYYLQGRPELSMEIRAYYPDFRDFIDSTAAARLNGLVAGYGDREFVDAEKDSYGLSPEGIELLKRMF